MEPSEIAELCKVIAKAGTDMQQLRQTNSHIVAGPGCLFRCVCKSHEVVSLNKEIAI